MAAHPVLDAKTRAKIKRLAATGRHTDTEIGRKVGVSARTVGRALREPEPKASRPPVSPADVDADDGHGPAIDWTAPPLDLARALLRHATETIAQLQADSPRLNPTRTEARNLARLISRLEQEQAKVPTADEAERQRRRDDGDTRKKIEQYVEQALARSLAPSPAAPHGRCPTCSSALSPAQRAGLLGTAP